MGNLCERREGDEAGGGGGGEGVGWGKRGGGEEKEGGGELVTSTMYSTNLPPQGLKPRGD